MYMCVSGRGRVYVCVCGGGGGGGRRVKCREPAYLGHSNEKRSSFSHFAA